MSVDRNINSKEEDSSSEIQKTSLIDEFTSKAEMFFRELHFSFISKNFSKDEEKIRAVPMMETGIRNFTLSFIKNWNLPNDSIGFFLSSKQFSKIAELFKPLTNEPYGILKFQIYPESGHLVFRKDMMENYVFPTYGLSSDFPYFQWEFNGNFCKDWIKFNRRISNDPHYFVFISAENKFSTLLLSEDLFTNRKWCGILISKFPQGNFRIEMDTHVGGGRVYHESSARKYNVSPNDEIIL